MALITSLHALTVWQKRCPVIEKQFIFGEIKTYTHLCHRRINQIKNINMPSFDIASKVDLQTLDNAINTVRKEIINRFDFKDSHVVIELNKKDFIVNLETESDMKMKQVIDVII